MRWFDRTFELGLPASAAPAIVARLRSTADRLVRALDGVPQPLRVHRHDGRWSMQEHAGHLLDLESLFVGRLDDFNNGAASLGAADLENRKTHEAGHNRRSPDEIVAAFRAARAEFVRCVEAMDSATLSRSALHPRLRQPMTVVDHCFFVAEHDDHHLAAIAELDSVLRVRPLYALDLLNTIADAEPALLAMDDRHTAQRPAPGKWSPREIVGHLVDSASNNHQRFVRAQFQDDLVFPGYAQDDWVAAQRYQDAPWRDLVGLWAGFNRHLARVMIAMSAAARMTPRSRHNLDRIALGPFAADAPATLDAFMEDYVKHLKHHLAQIGASGLAALPPR